MHDDTDPFADLGPAFAKGEASAGEGGRRGPLRRDPWDEYAIEKVQAQLIDDEFYLADQNSAFTIWALISAGAIIATVVKASLASIPASGWDVAFTFFAALLFIICVTLRVHGHILARRVERRLKWLDRHGVELL